MNEVYRKYFKSGEEPARVTIQALSPIDKIGNINLNPDNISRWYQKSNPFKDKKCCRCYYLPVCYGGCPLNYIKTGKRRCTSKDMAITPYFYS